MKIILTGGTGYFGSQLLRQLNSEGHELLCICLPGTSQKINVPALIVNTDDDQYAEKLILFKPEAVIHLAGVYERDGLSAVIDGNLLFPLELLRIACQSGITKWINTDTALPENLNAYALSKHQFAAWGEKYSERCGFTFINVRLEHFYGPSQGQNNFIGFVLDRLKKNETLDLTACTQKRDFVFIEDVCSAYAILLKASLNGFVETGLGYGQSVCLMDLVEYLKEISGSDSLINYGAVQFRENEPMDGVADLSLLRTLGFQPQYDWRTGLKKILEED